MTYPHVTQCETVELLASLAARRARPKHARGRIAVRRLTGRRAPLRNVGGSACSSC
jgi:hypothetical protein